MRSAPCGPCVGVGEGTRGGSKEPARGTALLLVSVVAAVVADGDSFMRELEEAQANPTGKNAIEKSQPLCWYVW